MTPPTKTTNTKHKRIRFIQGTSKDRLGPTVERKGGGGIRSAQGVCPKNALSSRPRRRLRIGPRGVTECWSTAPSPNRIRVAGWGCRRAYRTQPTVNPGLGIIRDVPCPSAVVYGAMGRRRKSETNLAVARCNSGKSTHSDTPVLQYSNTPLARIRRRERERRDMPPSRYAGTDLSFRYTRKASDQNGFIFSAGVLQIKV